MADTVPETFRWDAHGGRVLAIDYGTKRIGLAVTDPMGWFAVGLPTVDRDGLTDEQAVEKVRLACQSYGLKKVVMGLPMHMDGSNSESADRARVFYQALAPVLGDIPFEWVDERLSSMEAEDRLREQGIQPSRNKALIDEMAAKILLEPYLS